MMLEKQFLQALVAAIKRGRVSIAKIERMARSLLDKSDREEAIQFMNEHARHLTKVEQKVLAYLQAGGSPVRTDICKHFGWSSKGTAQRLITSLSNKGFRSPYQ